MANIIKGLIGLASLAFLLAVWGTFWEVQVVNVSSEAYSRACTNLALIAIALAVVPLTGSSGD